MSPLVSRARHEAPDASDFYHCSGCDRVMLDEVGYCGDCDCVMPAYLMPLQRGPYAAFDGAPMSPAARAELVALNSISERRAA